MTLQNIAARMALHLEARKIIRENQLDIYGYGLEILISTVLNGILVLLMGALLGVFMETILMIFPFILLRSNAGGFHAKTHLGCILGFLAVYTACVTLAKALPPELYLLVSLVMLALSATALLLIGAVRHENRPVSDEEYALFYKKARWLTATLTAAGIAGTAIAPHWFIFYTLGVFIAASSLLAAWIKIKTKNLEETNK